MRSEDDCPEAAVPSAIVAAPVASCRRKLRRAGEKAERGCAFTWVAQAIAFRARVQPANADFVRRRTACPFWTAATWRRFCVLRAWNDKAVPSHRSPKQASGKTD